MTGPETPTTTPVETFPLLDTPRDGVPAVVDTPEALTAAAERLARGTGPVAVDAERASGHRYGQRAFLVQMRREGTGTVLIDPEALRDLSPVQQALGDAEWVLHAASQDLPCLAEVGLHPHVLFDTELGSRLAGLPRVGLAAVVEQLLGLSLAKEHSAADWSTRPLPEPWLRYAALDVEVLVDLRDAVDELLHAQGKQEWAHQEFAHVATAPPTAPRTDPWRRTSGMHRLRTRRQLAVLREAWQARDRLARTQDVAPGRLLPDASLVLLAQGQPARREDLLQLAGFTGRGAHRHADTWVQAVARAAALPEKSLPLHHLPSEGPPPPRAWADRNPPAAARLNAARTVMETISQDHTVPVENVLTPETVRRLCWEPPTPCGTAEVAAYLRAAGARPWQVDLTAEALAAAMAPATD